MRILFIFGFIFCFVNTLNGQSYTWEPIKIDENGNASYSEIVELPGLTKEQIHKKAHQWIAENFVDANEVIQINDIEAGMILGKGISYLDFVHLITYDYEANYIIKVESKDEKARITFDNILLSTLGSSVKRPPSEFKSGINSPQKYLMKLRNSTIELFLNRTQSLVDFIKSTPSDDWE